GFASPMRGGSALKHLRLSPCNAQHRALPTHRQRHLPGGPIRSPGVVAIFGLSGARASRTGRRTHQRILLPRILAFRLCLLARSSRSGAAMNVNGRSSKRPIQGKATVLLPARVGAASPIAPDCSGQDFYAIDAGLQQLLALYLPATLRLQLEPYFVRLGVLAGGKLDELARTADRNGPVLHPRDPFGRDEDWIEYHPSYREMETIAFADFQFHAMSHRAGALGLDFPVPAVATYAR